MSDGVMIRKAVADDLPACAAVINAFIDETDWFPRVYSHDRISGMFPPSILEDRTMWVVEKDGVVEGYMSLMPSGSVRSLYLSSALRGTGVGKRLIDTAKAAHPAFLELGVFEPNTRARAFYESQGFVEVPEKRDENTEEGVPVLLMRWEGGGA